VIQRVRASLAKKMDLSTTPHILIGCSGGRDSVALAWALSALVRNETISATIIHVDHRQRAVSATAADGVRGIADTLGVPFHLVTLDEAAIDRHGGVGPEEALRRERYLAFSNACRELQADAVAVAHHQRDQAETVLLHLIRGAGLHGVTGMRDWTLMDVPWWNSDSDARALTVWRPFLQESWNDIDAVATQSGLPIYEDESNADRRFRRNAIRLDVLQLLEDLATGATGNIARFAELAGEDDDLLDRMAEEILHPQPDGSLHRRVIVDQPVAIQRRVVQRWIHAQGFDGELTTNRIDAICGLAERNRSGSVLEIGSGWAVSIRQGVLTLQR
jgi:tRNA(Ile)-lysidine synthase